MILLSKYPNFVYTNSFFFYHELHELHELLRVA